MQPKWGEWKSYDQLEWKDESSYTQTKLQGHGSYRAKTKNKVIGSKTVYTLVKDREGERDNVQLEIPKM